MTRGEKHTLLNKRDAIRILRSWRMRGTLLFFALLFLGSIAGIMIFARPTISEYENRTLEPFPAWNMNDFLSGEYFTQISLWYADTFPARDQLIHINQNIERFFGIQLDGAFYGSERQSEEVPPVSEDEDNTSMPDLGGIARHDNAPPPDMHAAATELENQITDGVYVTDEAAYSLYYFSDDAAKEYAATINEAAKKLNGIAQVYSVLLPTNGGVLLDKELQLNLGGAPQEDAIDYFYSLMNDSVIPVETFDVLSAHKDEYIFFKTDHHWTQLGAYYVYESFCKAKGIEPAPYDGREELVFDGFTGSYLYEFNLYQLDGVTDTLYARIPFGTNEMNVWADDTIADGSYQSPIIRDLSDTGSDNYYQVFANGNAPLSSIENPRVHDGSSCLIIKDSYGNPFTTVMVDSYQYIYTCDFRFTSQDLLTLVETYGIQDVIFENSVLFAGTYDASAMLDQIISGRNADTPVASKDN